MTVILSFFCRMTRRYQLVNLVARRARAISANAEEKQIPLERKPVSSAIDEVYTGKLSIKE